MKDIRLIGHSGNNRYGIRTFSSVLQYRTDKSAVVEISVQEIIGQPYETDKSMTYPKYYRAEVIEPFSQMFGYWASGLSVESAKARLSDKLTREFGYIGTLIQPSEMTDNEKEDR